MPQIVIRSLVCDSFFCHRMTFKSLDATFWMKYCNSLSFYNISRYNSFCFCKTWNIIVRHLLQSHTLWFKYAFCTHVFALFVHSGPSMSLCWNVSRCKLLGMIYFMCYVIIWFACRNITLFNWILKGFNKGINILKHFYRIKLVDWNCYV